MLLGKFSGVPATRRRSARSQLLAGAALIVAIAPAAAQDATWLGLTSNYFSASNWNPNTVPTGTAYFDTAPTTVVQIGSPVSVGGWTFAAGAPAYTFNGSYAVSFGGAGIVGSPTITNNATLQFFNNSTAGAANITNNGLINFGDFSSAGSATITANSGGHTYFSGNASGGTANLIANGTGVVDFSQLVSAGTTAGSFQGSGNFFLGSKTITVGGNNLSTTVSGVIADGGIAGGAGGALVKEGAGILTLTSANTYSGGTTITGGFINFNAASNLGTGAITLNGGGLQWAGGATTDISSRLAPLGLAGATFDTNGNNVTFATGLSGDGGITKTGAGTLKFTAGNAYTGATNINGGTLLGGAANVFSAASATTVHAGGTLDLGGFAQTINALTLAGGTLQHGQLAGAITSTGGTISAVTGTANLTTTAGTTMLTGANGYSGATNINGGTLLGGNANAFSAVSATTVNTGGTLDLGNFAQTINALTLAGGTLTTGSLTGAITSLGGTVKAIGGAVSLTTTSGTTTLSGANSYTGATAINAGILLGGNANAFSAASTTTVNAGGTLDLGGFAQIINTLTLAGGAVQNGQLGGTITSAGGTVSGVGGGANLITTGGTTTLSGVNSYTGATTINGGTLLGGNANAFSAASATTINQNGTLDLGGLAQSINAVTLAGGTLTHGLLTGAITSTGGTISTLGGSAALTTTGGTTTLIGANTYTGPTNVNAGTLIVDGSAFSSTMTVKSGATLAGSGTIGTTTIMNGGTFAPGPVGAIGSMTVAGNLTFQSGASYQVLVDPTHASSANVTANQATLAGNVLATFAPGSYITKQYTILSASSIDGAFDNLSTKNLPAGFTANLSYGASDVYLNLTATLGAPSPSSPPSLARATLVDNAESGAKAINGYFNSGGALPANYLPLFGLTGSSLANALMQLSGEAATGAQQSAFRLTNLYLALMLDPLVYGGGASGGGAPFGLGAGGTAMRLAAEEAQSPEIALAYAKLLRSPATPAAGFIPEPRWNVWTGGYGGANRIAGDSTWIGSHDVSASAGGFAGGVDYRLWPGTTVGVSLAGGFTSWDLANALGGGGSDAFQAGIYGITRSGPGYIAGAVSFAEHWMTTDRFAFMGDHLTASFNAQNYAARIEGGWRLDAFLPGVTPYVALQAQALSTPAYSETDVNGGGFGLNFGARTANDTRSELGARFNRAMLVGDVGVVNFTARTAWAHDWVSDPTLAAMFQTLPGAAFTVTGASLAPNSALLSAGSELRFFNGWGVGIHLDGEFAGGAQSYAGTGTVRYAW